MCDGRLWMPWGVTPKSVKLCKGPPDRSRIGELSEMAGSEDTRGGEGFRWAIGDSVIPGTPYIVIPGTPDSADTIHNH